MAHTCGSRRQIQLDPIHVESIKHMNGSLIESHIVGKDVHSAHTTAVALENTLWGVVLPLSNMKYDGTYQRA